MQPSRHTLLVPVALLFLALPSRGQESTASRPAGIPSVAYEGEPLPPLGASAAAPAAVKSAVPLAPASPDDLDALQKNMEHLQKNLVAAKAAAADDEKLKMQVELLQKQIEVQQKMIQLLMDHVKKQPLAGSPAEKMQTQVATLEARARQAALRDQELAQQVDNIVEHQDANERYGPQLPATLKELFLPSETNESPLSIYTNLSFGYSKLEGQPGGFMFGEFAPHFRLVLNNWIYAIGEIDVFANGVVDAADAEVDFVVNDWLTIVAGRFPAPIGFFNERLNSPWINKLPDAPLMFKQVSPPMSLLGLQARGATYLGNSPFKLEYSAYVSNGLELNNQAPGLNDVANLENMQNTYNFVTNAKMYGGRVALWYPEMGLEVGLSGLLNGSYTPITGQAIRLWDLDLNYHKGNWDVRFEYAELSQDATDFIGNDIRRQGLYAQVAYRQYDAPNPYLQKIELVGRYSYATFHGIDPTALDLTRFTTSLDVPVTRHQYTVGLNYWIYPSMVCQLAYQVNSEPGFPLRDNVFLAQFGWGF
jgi:hypothetical protein